MRRRYRAVQVAPHGQGFAILLDAKPVATPARTELVLPTRPLAEAVAAEWAAQEGEVKPLTMPLTRLAATVADRAAAQRTAMIEEIAAYAGNDLLCYRVVEPAELLARQCAVWDPLLAWAAARHGIVLEPVSGILHREQPQASLAAARARLEALDAAELTALHVLTIATGSAVLALALIEGELDTDAAFEAAHLEEIYQIERWGEDREAARRRREIRDDIRATRRFLDLLKS